METVKTWMQHYFPRLRSEEPVQPRKDKVTEVLACFTTTEGDGAYPPAEATIMFMAACILLVLPTLRRMCDKRFLRKLGRLIVISVTLTVLTAVVVMVTAVQASCLFVLFVWVVVVA